MTLNERHLDHYMALWREYWHECGTGYPSASAVQQFLTGGSNGVPWRTRIPAGVNFGGADKLNKVRHIKDGMDKLEQYHARIACAVWLYYFLVGRDADGALIKNLDRADLLGISEPVYLQHVRRGKDFLMGFL